MLAAILTRASLGVSAMWSEIFELAVVLLAVWLLWRFVAPRIPGSMSKPAEPGDFEGSPARLRPRPKSGAGAVALAEPDEEEDEAS